MKRCAASAPARPRRLSLAVAVAVLVAVLPPAATSAKPKSNRPKRNVTFTVNLPAKRAGALGDAKPVLASLEVIVPGIFPPEDVQYGFFGRFLLIAQQLFTRAQIDVPATVAIGSKFEVGIDGFWAWPEGSPPVRVVITDPDGQRAHLVLNGRSGQIVGDVFSEATDPKRPLPVSSSFSTVLRPQYPIGDYRIVASAANGQSARATFTVVVPSLPSGINVVRRFVTRGETIVLTWAGYPPGSPIGLLMYVRRPTDVAGTFVWEFFARFEPVPTDEYGSLEIGLPTDDAEPGNYCFVTDEPKARGCGENTVLVGS